MSKNENNNELELEYDILREFGLDKLRQTPKIILQHPIIAKIENMDRSWMTDKEEFLIDLFLLSYYTGGSTVAEMALFTNKEIGQKDFLTQKGRRVLFGQRGIGVINRYCENSYQEHALPIYTYKHQTYSQQLGRANRLTKQINLAMKVVSKKLNLGVNLSLSSTRQFRIEHMLEMNLPFDYISAIVGLSISTIGEYEQKMRDVKG